MIDLDYVISRFAANAEAVGHLAGGLSDEQARWKPVPEEWSLLEVVNHLYDEEREDFRLRLDLTLHQPDTAWPPIDPEGWAIARAYHARDPQASLANWLQERQRSLAWLRGLADPDWQAGREHPQAGVLTAGDLLASWLAHDYLHLRQMAQLHWQYNAHQAAPYGVRYAGPW